MTDEWGVTVTGLLAGVGWIIAWAGRPSMGRIWVSMLLTVAAAVMNGWYLRGVVGP